MHTIAGCRLSRPERFRLEKAARRTKDLGAWLRVVSVLRWARGYSQRTVGETLEIAQSSVARNIHKYGYGGIAAVLEDARSTNGTSKVTNAFEARLREVLLHSPQDFGWQRPTWTRELLAQQMARDDFPIVSVATMSRVLRRLGARPRAPKPFVECPWSRRRREKRLAALGALAASASADEPVYWVDEVDIHLNPKIGRDWTLPGARRFVRTPGKNAKHYLAGALDARTRELVYVEGDQKASWLFCNLCRALALRHVGARRIHLILDNYGIHSSHLTRWVLDEELDGLVELHFLPPYCPDANRIERLWLDLHANVTRNHRCSSLDELLAQVRSFITAYNCDERPALRRAA